MKYKLLRKHYAKPVYKLMKKLINKMNVYQRAAFYKSLEAQNDNQ
jgi:hypothetical protein